MDDKKEIALMMFLILGLSFTWYKAWVEPNDRFREAVLDCMDGDRSKAAYDNCIAMMRQDK